MRIKCPKCSKDYSSSLFQFEPAIVCDGCGTLITRDYVKQLENLEQSTMEEDDEPLTGHLLIEVISITGRCPVFKLGDKMILDEGYRLKTSSDTTICMHALASILPYYNAIYNGVPAAALGLARMNSPDKDAAFVQCLDPCNITNGGTVTFKITRS